MNRLLLIYVLTLCILGCASPKKEIARTTDTVLASALYANHFTGFLVLDPETNDTIFAGNSKRYFTPASNTKIFTLYTALQFLPEKVPALKYIERNDTLYIEGTGDPSFLHPHLKDSTALHFLRGHKNIALNLNNFQGDEFAPGWSWGDYQYYYQPERNPLPLYGNVVTLRNARGLHVTPSYFQNKVIPINFTEQRALDENIFYFATSRKDTVETPFKIDSALTRQLLEDILDTKIRLADRMPSGNKNILYGLPADTLYRRMMHESDNMIAEQLLFLASATLSDTLNSSKVRDAVLSDQLSDLRQPPRWVDGSGLSRYNLFTPESMVHVLHKLYEEVPQKRLFELFPAAGVTGTLKNWYVDEARPYLFAKSGSLSNNYCVSGYLLTKSGKTLIFSFMNNHYKAKTSEVKKGMLRIFEEIRDTY